MRLAVSPARGGSRWGTVHLLLAVALLLRVSSSAAAEPRESERAECPEATQLRERELAVAKKWFPALRSGSTPSPFVQVGGCVRQQAGWWSYEVCPGKWIRQLHEEGGRIQSEYFLGFGPGALDDDEQGNDLVAYRDHTATMREQISRGGFLRPSISAAVVEPRAHCRTTPGTANQRKRRAPTDVVVDYPSGTMCEVTGAPRAAKIIYVCDAAKRQFVWNITETRPCHYLLFVVGRVACEMMATGEAAAPAGKRAGADIRRYPSSAQSQGGKKPPQSSPSAQTTTSLVDAANAFDDELAPGVRPSQTSTENPPANAQAPEGTCSPSSSSSQPQDEVVGAPEQPDVLPSAAEDDDDGTGEADEWKEAETYDFEEHMIFAI